MRCHLRKKAGTAGNAGVPRALVTSTNARRYVFAVTGAIHDFTVHYLFASKLNPVDQPANSRMKPQHGPDDFFRHGPQPVAALHMNQLMGEYG